MSNFMQIGDAQNDIVLVENNVIGDQLTTTLTKANGQPISSPPVTLPSGGGGGTPIGAGYTLSITSDSGGSVYPPIVVLGLYNGTYGWHNLSSLENGVVENASMMYVKGAIANLSRASSTMTTSAIYDLQNTALTKDTLFTYRGLACILSNCEIFISD